MRKEKLRKHDNANWDTAEQKEELNWELAYSERTDSIIKTECRIMLKGRCEADVEDVAEKTKENLLHGKCKSWYESGVNAWIKSAAHNCSIDYLRHENRCVPFSSLVRNSDCDDEEYDESWIVDVVDYSRESDVEYTAISDEKMGKLRQILDILDERDKAILIMRGYEEIPVKEVAERLGIKEGTVKSSFSRSREKVRALCIENGILPETYHEAV